MRTLLLLSFAFALVGCDPTVNNTSTAPNTSVSKVLAKEAFAAKIKSIPNVQLVDVRTPDEIAGGSIATAMHIDFNGADFKQNMLTKLDKNKPVFVFCRSGGRSGKTATMLQKEGFKEIYDLEGGYLNWSK